MNNKSFLLPTGLVTIVIGIVALLWATYLADMPAASGSCILMAMGLVFVRMSGTHDGPEQLENPPEVITIQEDVKRADFRRWNATKNSILLRWALSFHGHKVKPLRIYSALRSVGLTQKPKNADEFVKRHFDFLRELNAKRHLR